jgi:hypothetical protein
MPRLPGVFTMPEPFATAPPFAIALSSIIGSTGATGIERRIGALEDLAGALTISIRMGFVGSFMPPLA